MHKAPWAPSSAGHKKPAKTQDISAILLSDSPLENFEILGKKDLEKDEPKGWLLAKTITV